MRPVIRVKGRARQYHAEQIPNLIEIQLNSYFWFLKEGLRDLFDNFSPIEDFTGSLRLSFGEYTLGDPKYSIEECRDRDATYEAPLKVQVQLLNTTTGEMKESEVYLGDLPIMTDTGTFVINGAERAVVSQLARSPGVYFKDNIDYSGRILYNAQVIPSEGAWLDFDTDANGVISVKIGQAHKFPATTLLRALHRINVAPGSEAITTSLDSDLIALFGKQHELQSPTSEQLTGMRAWEDIVDTNTGEVLVERGVRIDRETARRIGALALERVVITEISPLIETTLEKDPTRNEDQALIDIYRRDRPGDPVTPELARQRLAGIFSDPRRYDLAKVGRYMMNKKLGLAVPEPITTLTKEDVIAILQYLVRLDTDDPTTSVDEIDHLMNKRVRSVGELLQNQFRLGFLRMERIIRERMTSLDQESITPQAVISTKPISAAIKSFFGSSQLSQFMDQTNPLAELTHKRRLSALGPGGLSRQSAKLEVRDVHHSHYGRICPIETPEGPNIGLIGSMAVYGRLNVYGFLETPYRRIVDSTITPQIEYLTADEEEGHHIVPATTNVDDNAKIQPDKDGRVICRFRSSYPRVLPEEIDYMDLSPKQTVSVATSLIPFLENDDANRALMGSNMQRQSVPLVCTQAPFVMTGLEDRAATDSGAVRVARAAGRVSHVDASRIAVTRPDGTVDNYRLINFLRSNQATSINQKPMVQAGQFVRKGEPLADGPCTSEGHLALGRNILVAFMPWEGYNYEDAIILSDRLYRQDVYTSIHIEKYEIEARETKVGPEEITRDIPNVGDEALRDLDEDGVIRIGAEVRAEDILVGKVAPKGQEELTSEEKLVRAIFGEKAAEMRDTSLRVPHGEKGKVVDVKRFSRVKSVCERCGTEYQLGKAETRNYCDRCGSDVHRIPGDELTPGVNQLVRTFVAQRRKIMEGDKMAGRHGNKGVVSKILPQEDMPHLPDGTPVDIILNPLGVPSRMNIGQIMETHLGVVANDLNCSFENPIFEGAPELEILTYLSLTMHRRRRQVLTEYMSQDLRIEAPDFSADLTADRLIREIRSHDLKGLQRFDTELDTLYQEQLREAARQVLPHMTEEAPFELVTVRGVSLEDWKAAGNEQQIAWLADELGQRVNSRIGFDPTTGKCWVYDGRTGDKFNQPVTIGFAYMMKLVHLVDDKIHARSTGPYSLVTQQPLGGKAQFGGQRFGEMEVWALEAYGAAHTLQEILTIKSDDVMGRVKTYESIVKGANINEPGIPESFKILIKELQSLGLQIQVENAEAERIDLELEEEDSTVRSSSRYGDNE
ncbi:MAG: DNA-directed RNA polymerase subunit beta [Armatimonadota bacterium]